MRLTHWLNAVAIFIMVTSGWRIYNASPIFGFEFPAAITLGGWLGGAILWHFAAMWLFFINGLVYLLLNLLSGRWRSKFLPLSLRGLWHDALQALKGHLAHDDLTRYNMVQKVAYLSLIGAGVLVFLSGLVVWKPVQFPLLATLMTGFDNARVVHFWSMAFIVAFVAVHLVMVALVPRTLRTIILGR
ncbi:MAG: cytochrome b/b6 domain-containing protein [Burkholderiales bacterium]